ADKFRQSVTYPMDKVATDDTEFMRSYYADHAVYNHRQLNPAQADMGNFSRSDFSHITPITKTVNVTSKKNFRSTGAYAIPGQTFKVTRNDTSDLTVKVFINTLRSGATHQYEKNSGYKRPKYLQTPYFEIASGETIELTSPYGGPLQLSFSTNDLPVQVTFENVGEHAYWAGTADDASFTAKLDAGEFDWAEVVTTGFEVHSKLEKMRESVADTKWGTAQALANATERYMSNFPHVLAGFQGPGIDMVDEIHDFATSNNLTIETLDLVKHMNADQALCGYGCSGNPYDAYWSYSPVGHGDVHELGHGLEKHRFRFAGWEGHSITNPYSYYTKSKYNETVGSTGNLTECQNLPFESVFETLQESVGQANIVEYLQTNLWENSGWSQQFMVLLQAVMHAQKMGKLENGWHLLARLHILEREISRADDDWEANKASIGFSSYSLEEFNDISNSSLKTTDVRRNDWMLVSLSYAAGLDYRNYLTMFGIAFSQKASDQVASFNYPIVPQAFFISSSSGYCNENINGDFLAKSTLPIDGTQVWPAETDTDGDGYWDALDNCPSDSNSDQADTNNNGQGDVCDLDADSDGASSEDMVPDASGIGTGDGNDDSIADSNQASVTSLQSHGNTGWLTYHNPSEGAQSNFVTSAAPLTAPADQFLKYGTTQFDVVSATGASVTIEVHVARDTSIEDYLLQGNDGTWVAQNATITHNGNKTKLVFTVTEGGNFDRDATVDGVLQLVQGGVMVRTGLEVWPYAYLFGNVDLNTQTAAKSFKVKNTGSRLLAITGVETTGNHADEFVISSDGCSGQSLLAQADCTFTASFQPTSMGSKSALINITSDDPDNASASIFVRNHEADEEESERRLPPVLNSYQILGSSNQPVNSMSSNMQYTVEWSILGYHEDYITSVVMFNCTGIADNTTCGANFSDNTRFISSGRVDRYLSTDGVWKHQGIQSKVNQYRYTFTTPDFTSSTPIVIRFYRLNSKDLKAGNAGLSLVIPGNHAEDYYDTTGRRVKNTISP
ncbi:MAG: FIG01200241: hypothetical protein, partial [uncultured Thiotrichaceae bacterium]